MKLVRELAEQLDPLLDPTVRAVDSSSLKWNKDPAQKSKVKEAILVLKKELSVRMESASGANLSASGLDHAGVDALLRGLCEKTGIKLGELTQPLRLFVTGHPQASIGLFDLLPLVPWPTLSARLDACLES